MVPKIRILIEIPKALYSTYASTIKTHLSYYYVQAELTINYHTVNTKDYQKAIETCFTHELILNILITPSNYKGST